MFKKILIANRGEIAIRIARTCRRLRVATVAVYSEADARALHVEMADEAVLLGPAPAAASYLRADRILEAALETGCDAIHPGYGFLSENPSFARDVAAAGLVFIGPPPEAMALLGDKIAARRLAVELGLPVVPGSEEPLETAEEVATIGERTGYPLLLKPAAGGGGKGMKVVESADQLEAALAASRQEALKAFGDARVFVERCIPNPRHVEFQVLADAHGGVVHLGERECSIQRRHQKMIEEAPSLAVGGIQRRRMGQLSCDLARAAGYVGAGTVEFIFDPEGEAFFLEMNPRLQVEHPVTEAVTGLDLVELQLLVASGAPLPFTQDEITISGWAIEARVCAEDPSRAFTPSTGMITRLADPELPGVRVDSSIRAGSPVNAWYDSLLAKVIAHGETRDAALQTLIRALNGFHVEGVQTTIDLVNAILAHSAFQAGDISTGFIEAHLVDGRLTTPPRRRDLHVMVVAAALVFHVRQAMVRESVRPMASQMGQARSGNDPRLFVARAGEHVFRVSLSGSEHQWRVEVDGEPHEVMSPPFEYYRRRLTITVDGEPLTFRVEYREHHVKVAYRGLILVFELLSPREFELSRHLPGPRPPAAENELRCPMPGLLVRVLVAPGDHVFRGQDLLAIESMKMESLIPSPQDGQVAEVLAEPGQAVEAGQVLVSFEV